MIRRADFIDLMAGVRNTVDSCTRSKVAEIIALVEKYRYLAEDFTFDKDGELDYQVNQILIKLSDRILGEMDALVEGYTDEVDKDAVFLYIRRAIDGKDNTERMDVHGSHLKYLLEGWLAIGFAHNLTAGQIQSEMFAHLGDAYSTKMWKDAVRSGEYDSMIIQEGGYHYGSGVSLSPVDGMTLVGQQMLNEAYQYGMMLGYRRQGAIGYRVHRGSTYDCPVCDALCVGIHTFDELCLPAHPRCCCYSTPVFASDYAE